MLKSSKKIKKHKNQKQNQNQKQKNNSPMQNNQSLQNHQIHQPDFINQTQQTIRFIKKTWKISVNYTGGRILLSHNNTFLCCLCNHQIAIVSLESNKLINKISHVQLINFCVHNSDKFIVTFTNNGLLRIVDKQFLKVLNVRKINKNFPIDMATENSMQVIALGCSNGHLQIFKWQTLQQTHYHVFPSSIKSIKFSKEQQKMQLFIMTQQHLIAYDLILSNVVWKYTMKQYFNRFDIWKQQVYLVGNSILKLQKGKVLKTIQQDQQIQDILITEECVWIANSHEVYGLNFQGQKDKYLEEVGINKIIKLMGNKDILIIVTWQQQIVICKENRTKINILIGNNDQITDLKIAKQNFIFYSTNINRAYDVQKQTSYIMPGHNQIILSLDFRECWVLTGSKDKLAKLWKILNFQPLQYKQILSLTGHNQDVTAVNISPSLQFLVTGSLDKTIKVYNFQGKNIHTVYAHNKAINQVKFSPCSNFILSCSHDKSIKVYEMLNMTQAYHYNQKSSVWDACFYKNGILVVTSSYGVFYRGNKKLLHWNQGGYRICPYPNSNGWVIASQGKLFGFDKLGIQKFKQQIQIGYKIWALDMIDKKIVIGCCGQVMCYEDYTLEKIELNKRQEFEKQKLKMDFGIYISQKKYQQALWLCYKNNFFLQFNQTLRTVYNQTVDKNNFWFQNDKIRTNQQLISIKALENTLFNIYQQGFDWLFKMAVKMVNTVRNYQLGCILLQILFKKKKVTQIIQMIKKDNKQKNDLQFIESLAQKLNHHEKRLQKYITRTYIEEYFMTQQGKINN